MKVHCSYCGRETEREGNVWHPFCSERCQTIDLGRWLSGDYRIAVEGFSGPDGEGIELEGESLDGRS